MSSESNSNADRRDFLKLAGAGVAVAAAFAAACLAEIVSDDILTSLGSTLAPGRAR